MPDKELNKDDSALLEQLRSRIIAQPSLLRIARSLINELGLSLEQDSGKKWANIIRNEGAALAHGKFHPDWFTNQPAKELKPLEKEPGFADAGQINTSPKNMIEARSPLSGQGVDVIRFGSLPTSPVRITEGTQALLMSPPQSAESPYNEKMLDKRFAGEWTEFLWTTTVNTDPNVPQRVNKYQFTYKVFLPTKTAEDYFQAIQEDPELPINLAHNLWPNLPIPIVNKDRLFIKKLSNDDLNKKYADPFIGGNFLSYEQQS